MVLAVLGAKNLVAGITQPRDDVAHLVQMAIDGCRKNIDIRMRLMQSLDTFRCSDDKHTLDIFSTMLFDIIYCCNSGSTGCKHRIYDNDKTLVKAVDALHTVWALPNLTC